MLSATAAHSGLLSPDPAPRACGSQEQSKLAMGGGRVPRTGPQVPDGETKSRRLREVAKVTSGVLSMEPKGAMGSPQRRSPGHLHGACPGGEGPGGQGLIGGGDCASTSFPRRRDPCLPGPTPSRRKCWPVSISTQTRLQPPRHPGGRKRVRRMNGAFRRAEGNGSAGPMNY